MQLTSYMAWYGGKPNKRCKQRGGAADGVQLVGKVVLGAAQCVRGRPCPSAAAAKGTGWECQQPRRGSRGSSSGKGSSSGNSPIRDHKPCNC